MASRSSRRRKRRWTVDCAATHNMTSKTEQFTSLGGVKEVEKVVIGDGFAIPVEGSGQVLLDIVGQGNVLEAGETLHVPYIARHLLSVTTLMKNGNDVNFRSADMSCRIVKDEEVVARPFLDNNLWVLDTWVDGTGPATNSLSLHEGTSMAVSAMRDVAPSRGARMDV